MNVARTALEYLFDLERFGIKFGLDNMRVLVEGLGHPDRAYRVVHVAGTNGKGSATAMIDRALRAAGHRVGRYTSPHLRDVTERFVIDGEPVTEDRLEQAASHLRGIVRTLLAEGRLRAEPTFFEATTALALQLFRDAGVSIAVCEVGLGGRLDATNVLSPAVTAITSIGRDHMQYLGSTLAEIAVEKAGIIKAGVPVVVGDLPPEAAAPIAQIAKERNAPLIHAKAGVTLVDDGAEALGGHRIRLRTLREDYGAIRLGLAGAHQISNALIAVRVLEVMATSAVPVSSRAVRAGLEDVRWPGRLDLRSLPDGRHVLLDAAHNPEGAQALAAFLTSAFSEPPALVFTAMQDKEVSDMLRALLPVVRGVILTRAATARSGDPVELAKIAHSVGARCSIAVEPELERALDEAWRLTPTIVVAGSIYLLGDTMKALGLS